MSLFLCKNRSAQMNFIHGFEAIMAAAVSISHQYRITSSCAAAAVQDWYCTAFFICNCNRMWCA